ncbi:DUF1194 domain-containing protein [Sabulicella rubraurantiaca]|uniref:DUF1194 domain-containing protein n=1 Tax=Sabulicella rubraurantiaca TaxID=2811429 RepID=UPI001A95A5F0|nr:DUF1194 domain-containing protein [Sabulicella rubraurantiaca]
MRRRPLLAAPLLLAAGEAVDLLLVLAVDASGSISPEEFLWQREGYAEALTSAAVISVIESKPRGIGVAMLEWGAPGGAETVVPWHRVTDAASARRLADAVLAAPRSRQSWNAIGDALLAARDLLHAAPFAAASRIVDLSGDGPDIRSLVPAAEARDRLVEEGITVNALAIAAEGQVTWGGQPLAEHYRDEVIGGPGAFVLSAEDRRDLARALRIKLVREIA